MADELVFTFDKETIQAIYEALREDFPDKFSQLMEDLAEIYRLYMVDFSPWITSNMRQMMEKDDTGDYSWYVYSDVPYFDDVVGGHKVYGPIFSDKQRRWWFWYLKNVLGGSYTSKGGYSGNDFPAQAYDAASGEIDAKIQEFLSSLGT